MPKASPYRHADGTLLGVAFVCPGCKSYHALTTTRHAGNGARWNFNGDYDKPTITPSILSTSEWDDESALTEADYGPWTPIPGCEDAKQRDVLPGSRSKVKKHREVCHSFVTAGRIQFLGDCTHELRGQTVDLREAPKEEKT